jgi:hypothetical protein
MIWRTMSRRARSSNSDGRQATQQNLRETNFLDMLSSQASNEDGNINTDRGK